MEVLSKNTAQKTMNKLGAAGEAFLSIISYRQEQNYVIPLSDINPALCKMHFPGMPENISGKGNSGFQFDFTAPGFETYQKVFNQVMRHIRRGDTYLCNLTFETAVQTDLSIESIFQVSKSPYKLWLKDKLVCFSPECFVRISGNRISTYPMKGTIDADIPGAADILLTDPKEKAEHYTITDLLRNDLSMISSDVEVSRYRYVESIQTSRNRLLQTSTEIAGYLSDGWQQVCGDILFTLLPAGSVTGAPKKKTTEITDKLESHDRGFYTGVCAYFDGRNLDSFVMIRMITERDGKLFYKSGGGITSFSDAKKEYEEMIQKIYVPVH
ncbi:MAG: aminodeoxychorismate synthase component I [Bacteroidales bacterium]